MPPIPTAGAIAALRAEARFRQAVATIVADNVEYYRGRWLAHRVLNDRARFLLASIMLYLHFDRRGDVAYSGLTAPRLREICVGVDLCGVGRVEAVLLMMRASGYLERAEGASDPHVRRYVPTAKLINLTRNRQRRALEAIDTVRGGTTYAARICGENELEVYGRFVSVMARGFLAGFRIAHSAPELNPIIDRDVGLPLMMGVFLTSTEYSELCPERLQQRQRRRAGAALQRVSRACPFGAACRGILGLRAAQRGNGAGAGLAAAGRRDRKFLRQCLTLRGGVRAGNAGGNGVTPVRPARASRPAASLRRPVS